MIVIDPNILAYLYLDNPQSEKAETLYQTKPNWCAPSLWRCKFRSILSLYLRKEWLSFNDCVRIFQPAEQLINPNEYNVSVSSVLHLVQTSQCSSDDYEFTALAQELETLLITSDKKILRTFPGIAQSPNLYLTQESQ